jgi:lactate dehydrogenase-like 2-hydroxyacid dehydrogenase
MLTPMLPVVVDGCAERYDLIRLWEAEDPDALLRERGGEVLGVATNGQRPVDDPLLDLLPKLQIVAHFGVGYDSVDTCATGASSSPTPPTCSTPRWPTPRWRCCS